MFSQLPKHFTHKPAVMPLFLFDGLDSTSLFRVSNGLPMSLVRVRRREFTGVCELKDSDQETPAGLIVHNEFASSFIIANNIRFPLLSIDHTRESANRLDSV